MAYREVTRVETEEILRRWQAGEGLRRIASGTGISRIAVCKYVVADEEMGLFPRAPASAGIDRITQAGRLPQATNWRIDRTTTEWLHPAKCGVIRSVKNSSDGLIIW